MDSNILSEYLESEKVNMTVYDVFQTVPQAAIIRPVSAVRGCIRPCTGNKGLYTTVQAMFLLREGGRQGKSKKGMRPLQIIPIVTYEGFQAGYGMEFVICWRRTDLIAQDR